MNTIDKGYQLQVGPTTQLHSRIETSLSKGEKLQLLKYQRQEKEKKLKLKLDIYSSVRASKTDKAFVECQNLIDKYTPCLQQEQHQSNMSIGGENKDRDLLQKYLQNNKLTRQSQSSSQQRNSEQFNMYMTQQSKFTTTTPSRRTNVSSIKLTQQNSNNISQFSSTTKLNQTKSNFFLKSPQSDMRQSRSNPNFKSTMHSRTFAFEDTINKEKQMIERQLDRQYSIDGFNTDELSIPDMTLNFGALSLKDDSLKNIVLRRVLMKDVTGLVKDLDSILSGVQKRSLVNMRDKNGRTPLFFSIYNQQYEMCEVLLRSGAETGFCDHLGRTVLHIACCRAVDKRFLVLLLDYSSIQEKQRTHLQQELLKNDKFKSKMFDQKPLTQNQRSIFNSQSSFNISKQQQQPINMKHQLDRKHLNGIQEEEELQHSDMVLASGSMINSRSSNDSKLHNEIAAKNSKAFKEAVENFINTTDRNGKTALHYAAASDAFSNVKTLIAYKAIPFIRDQQNRKPSNLCRSQDVRSFLVKEETIFEECLLSAGRHKPNISISQMNSLSMASLAAPLTNKLKQSKTLELGSISQLSQYSNQQLSLFQYGIYNDNALTYMMRLEDKEKFEYILQRGILPSASDQNDENALHYAVRLEKLNFLSYFFEGDYDAFEWEQPELQCLNQNQFNQTCKSYMFSTQSQMGVQINQKKVKTSVQIDALQIIDKSSAINGVTPFHEAAKVGSLQVIQYLMKILKKRNQVLDSAPTMSPGASDQTIRQLRQTAKQVKDLLEFTDTNNMTMVLVAAKHSNLKVLQYLLDEGANIYPMCSNLQNVLHYAVSNQDDQMIRYLIQADSENQILLTEFNSWNKLSTKTASQRNHTKRIVELFNSIYTCISHKNQTSYEKLAQKIEQTTFNESLRTSAGWNTPLHFAVMYRNTKALKMLVEAYPLSQSLDLKNRDGMTPKDLALFIKAEDERNTMVSLLSRDYTQYSSQLLRPQSSRRRKLTNKSQTTSIRKTQTTSGCNKGLDKSEYSQVFEADYEMSPLTPQSNNKHLQVAQIAVDEENFQTQSTMDIVKQQQTGQKELAPQANLMFMEMFIKRKQDSYIDHSRLGNFSPDLYYSLASLTKDEAKSYSARQSPSSGAQKSQTMTKWTSNKRENLQYIFDQIDQRQLKSFTLEQIFEEKIWSLMEEICSETEGTRLKSYLQNHYVDTVPQISKQTLNDLYKKTSFANNHSLSNSTQHSQQIDHKDLSQLISGKHSQQQPIFVNPTNEQMEREGEECYAQQLYLQNLQRQRAEYQKQPIMQERTNRVAATNNPHVQLQEHQLEENKRSLAGKVRESGQGKTLNVIPEMVWENESRCSQTVDQNNNLTQISSKKLLHQDSSKNSQQFYTAQTSLKSSNKKASLTKKKPSVNCSYESEDSRTKQESKKEKLNILKTRLKQLFLNYCDFSLQDGNIFITFTNFMKVMKDSQILSDLVNQNTISLIISKECNAVVSIIKHITFDQFLNCTLRIAEIKYPDLYAKHPKSALQSLLKHHLLPLLVRIEDAVNHSQDTTHQNSLYSVSEVTLKLIVFNEDTQVIFTDILPIVKSIYSKYFEQESINCKSGKKEDVLKLSLKSVMNFTRDFELCPYLVHQKACFLIWYSVAYGDGIADLTNNDSQKRIIAQNLNRGKAFTLAHFVIFLYRLGIIYFNHSQDKANQFNLIKKLLYFLRKLENSDGIKKFLVKLGRTFNEALTFLPSKDLLVQILKAEGVDDIGICNPHGEQYSVITKETMIARIVDNHLFEEIEAIQQKQVQVNQNHNSDSAGEQEDEDEIFLQNSHDDLKKLFEIYCSFGDPLNTKYIKSSKVFKMFRDCGLIKGQSSLAPNCRNANQITTQELDLVFMQKQIRGDPNSLSINTSQFGQPSSPKAEQSSMFLFQSQMQSKLASPSSVRNSTQLFNSGSKTTSFDYHGHLIDRGSNQGRLDFNQFKKILETLCPKIYPEICPSKAYIDLLQQFLIPLLQQVSEKRCVHNNMISDLLMQLDNPEMISLLTLFHKSVIDIYRYYADKKGYMNFQQYVEFNTSHDIFPEFATKATLYRIFHSLCFINEVLMSPTKSQKSQNQSSRMMQKPLIQSQQANQELLDEHLFVESLALIALYNEKERVQDNFSPSRRKIIIENQETDERPNEKSAVEKILGLIERMANSDGVYRKQKTNDISNQTKCNLMDKKDILEPFRQKYSWYFRGRYEASQLKKQKKNFDDIMDMSSILTDSSQME